MAPFVQESIHRRSQTLIRILLHFIYFVELIMLSITLRRVFPISVILLSIELRIPDAERFDSFLSFHSICGLSNGAGNHRFALLVLLSQTVPFQLFHHHMSRYFPGGGIYRALPSPLDFSAIHFSCFYPV